MQEKPLFARSQPARKGETLYPPPFAAQVAGREKRRLGDVFGLTHYGVNLTLLDPGAASALRHSHTEQDEFVYVLEGAPTAIIGDAEYVMAPGDCVGFKAGTRIAHRLVNRSDTVVSFLEIGDRSKGDAVEYPDDDLSLHRSDTGAYVFTHKDGTPY